MINSDPITVYSTDWLTLFNFEQNYTRTAIKILSRQTNFQRMVHNRDFKGGTAARLVRFTLCGLELSDSFEALSIVHSLIKVFEHRQFGTGHKSLVMRYPTSNDPELRLFCAIQPYKDAYEGLRLGWMGMRDGKKAEKEHAMHIGYVHHLRNALHRAMSWINPETLVKRVELPEIKEEWKRPVAPSYPAGRY
jgi:hypothetical protein